MGLEPPINDPDWGRYKVATVDAAPAPAGDPIKWGGAARTPIGNDIPAEQFGIVRFRTPPLAVVAATDNYARGWSITGSVRMPRSVFYSVYPVALGGASTPAPGTYPFPTVGGVNLLLEVTVGQGQISYTQWILLNAGGQPTLGICNVQAAVNGGPYAELYSEEQNPLRSFITRPFAAISSLAGNSIIIRGVYELGGVNEWADAILSLSVAPLAAGTRI